MVDYWLNKLLFDLQSPAILAEYRAHRETVIGRYLLVPAARNALMNDDITMLVLRGVNPYLVRMYGYIAQVPEDSFLHQIEATAKDGAPGWQR
jgi:hypothetical protein